MSPSQETETAERSREKAAERGGEPPKPPKDEGGGGGKASPQPLAAPTYLYGQYYGTPMFVSVPMQPVDQAYANGANALIVRDVIHLTAAASGSVVFLGALGWEAVLDIRLSVGVMDALGAGVTLSVGDVTYPSAFVNASSGAAAGTLLLLGGVLTANYFQPLWQQLGYASLAAAQLVGAKCQLGMTIGGAAATGWFAWEILGANRI